MKLNFYALLATLTFCTCLRAWNTPAVVSPSNGNNGWVGQTFDWNAVSASSAYQIEIDTTPGFNSPVTQRITKNYINSSSGNSDTQHNFGNLFFGKTYYWHVRAYVTGDTSAWSSSYTFLTRNYVTMSSPATASNTWTGLTLDWLTHTGVSFYDMQCDTSSLFNSPALRTSTDAYINSSSGNTDTDEYLNNLYFGTTYYWRVRARNAVDTSSWSTPWTFTTRDYVTMNSPATAATTWTGLTLDWLTHTGTGFYDMQCDTSSLFNSPALRTSTDAYINSSSGNTDTDEYLNNLYFGATYYWRVRARNAVDTSSWSAPWTFTTRDYVTMNSPATAATTWTGLTLDWLTHTGTGFYDMQCDTSSLFNSPALRTSTDAYINSSSGNTDTDEYLNNLYFGTTYYWRVRARNSVDTSSWSAPWTFTTRDYVSLNTPANGQLNVNTAGVTLDWLAHTGVAGYQAQWDSVNLYNSPAFQQANKTYINSSSGNTDTQNGSGPLSSNRVYFWRVRAWNGVDSSEWTERWFSTGTSSPVIPAVPVLISPVNASTAQPLTVNLVWNNSANAQSYEYQYSTNSSFASAGTYAAAFTSASISGLSQSTVYYWRVRALNGNIASAWSAPWQFTTTGPLSVPVLISPADLTSGISVSGTPLDWQDVVNATSYEYEYSADSTFATGVVSGATIVSDTVTATLSSLTTYFWRIRASDGTSFSPWSAVWSFTTELQLAAPVLISPADMSTGVMNISVSLDWNDVPNAVTYEYEYSTTSNFSANVVTGTTLGSDTATAALLPLTTYYWHVRAINGSIYSPWSATWSFTTDNSTAVLSPIQSNVRVFPVPATDRITIEGCDPNTSAIMKDASGRIVAVSNSTADRMYFDVAVLPDGIYFIEFRGTQPLLIQVIVAH